MRDETIVCDGCGKIIDNETTEMSNTVRYWDCSPVFRGFSEKINLVLTFPDRPNQFCPDCFNKMRKSLEEEECIEITIGTSCHTCHRCHYQEAA